MSADSISAPEAEAIRIVWESRGNKGPVPPSEEQVILAEIRQRTHQIEAEATKLGARAFAEGRHFPRRQQRYAYLMIAVGIAIIAIVLFTRSG